MVIRGFFPPTVSLGLLLVLGTGAVGAQVRSTADDVAAASAALRSTETSVGWMILRDGLFAQPSARQDASLRSMVADSLVAIAATAERRASRVNAIGLIMYLGTPEHGGALVDADGLRQLYEVQEDGALGLLVLQALAEHTDQAAAAAVLKAVAEGPVRRTALEGVEAVLSLLKLGSPGRAALEALYRERRMTNYEAMSELMKLARRGFNPGGR